LPGTIASRETSPFSDRRRLPRPRLAQFEDALGAIDYA
jgi:hypothetical protein